MHGNISLGIIISYSPVQRLTHAHISMSGDISMSAQAIRGANVCCMNRTQPMHTSLILTHISLLLIVAGSLTNSSGKESQCLTNSCYRSRDLSIVCGLISMHVYICDLYTKQSLET